MCLPIPPWPFGVCEIENTASLIQVHGGIVVEYYCTCSGIYKGLSVDRILTDELEADNW